MPFSSFGNPDSNPKKVVPPFPKLELNTVRSQEALDDYNKELKKWVEKLTLVIRGPTN